MTLTDRQDRSIKADVISVDGDKARIKRDDGQTFELPLSTLSDADQKKLREWARKNPPPLPANALQLQFSRGKFGSEKQTLHAGAVTAYREQWGYSLTLTNRAAQPLDNVRAEYVLFVKQDAGPGGKDRDAGMRKVRHTTRTEPIPTHGNITLRTETVDSYRYVLQPGFVWSGSGGSAKPIRDTLHGIWLRIYVGDQLMIEQITPTDLARTEKW